MDVYKTEAGRRAVLESYDRLVSRWGVATEERDLEGSFGTTHVILAGDASNPPLVMFHGVGDNSALMWVKNARELARHFRLIAIDTMGGAGKSVPDWGRYAENFSLVAWYGEVLDALGLEETFAVGVSYGAYHCQLLAASYPERVRKFVGVAGYAAAAGYERPKLATMLAMVKFFLPVMLMPTRRNVLKSGARIMGEGAESLLADPAFEEHFVALMRHYRMKAQFNHARRTFSRDEVASFRDKSLFLVGAEDALVQYPGSTKVMEDFGLRLITFPHAGHALNHVLPREVEAEIVGFLGPSPVTKGTSSA